MASRDIKGTNALTVLFSKDDHDQKTKMFFCPYRKSIVGAYTGKVVSIQPGYDPEDSPLFFVRPQRQSRQDNINYIFSTTKDEEDKVLFWIQDQYFDTEDVRVYNCFNCQAPQLYFDDEKAVDYKTRKDLATNTSYLCHNCKITLSFMGIVKIKDLWL